MQHVQSKNTNTTKTEDTGDTEGTGDTPKGLDLQYSIDDNPPWYLCILLGFQVGLESYHQPTLSKIVLN